MPVCARQFTTGDLAESRASCHGKQMEYIAAAWSIYWPWVILACIAGGCVRVAIDSRARAQFFQLFKDWWRDYQARRRAYYDWLRRKGLWRP
jgi:hypothetical protein